MDFKNNNEIKSYINDICDQVKNKRVHKEIIAELNAHLEEKINEHLKCGISESEVIKEAINEMGSSKHVGDELNEIHKCNPEWSVIAISITLVLLSIGFMSLFQINGEFYRWFGSSFIRDRTILWGAIGVIALLTACFIDYRKIKKYSKYIYIVSIVLLMITIIIPINTNGVKQWIYIGELSIKTGYFCPVFIIIALTAIYDKYEWNSRNNIIKGLLLGLVPSLLVSGTNSFGNFIVYGISLILLIYTS